jgi:hypothetical protein
MSRFPYLRDENFSQWRAVFPVVDKVVLDPHRVRQRSLEMNISDISTHWLALHKALESVFQDLGVAAMGAADREEWLAIQDFQHRVSDIMAWVADVLMPRGAEGLDAVLEHLQSRMAP